VHDDFVADLDVRDVLAHGIHDAGGVTAADVEGRLIAAVVAAGMRLVAGADDVDGDAQAGPHVVVVDARGHDVDEHLVVGDRRHVDDLLLERLLRRAEPLGADQPGVHLLGDLAQGRLLADLVDVLGHGASSLDGSLCSAGDLGRPRGATSPPRRPGVRAMADRQGSGTGRRGTSIARTRRSG
jgi:hypothetical protein